MDYIFGPVQSRRLGRSLGIDLFPRKICNLNCVYCEVGPTLSPVSRRAAYSPVRLICEEIDAWCAGPGHLASVDVLTVTAKGEPTLHSGLGKILDHLKTSAAGKPVAVLTNGTTLTDEEVRRELMAADLVVPSLDAVRDEGFARVDRPADGLEPAAIIDGMTLFSRDFPGKIWLEILLVRGMNDAPGDIAALVDVLGRMRIDRIQLNTVMRPPAEAWAHPLSRESLIAIAGHLRRELGLPVDLPFTVPDDRTAGPIPATITDPAMSAAIRDDILHMVQRRPCTAIDIDRTFHLGGPEKVAQLLDPLIRAGVLHRQAHGDSWYYRLASCGQGTDSGLPA